MMPTILLPKLLAFFAFGENKLTTLVCVISVSWIIGILPNLPDSAFVLLLGITKQADITQPTRNRR
jgi:hypothetical protein